MANIFKQAKNVNEHPNRNNFDLSKKINVSMKMGTLYPVYCQPVVPGDSFDIQAAYNLKLLPVIFPVQTKMRAHMHFFYVRNKNLWKNWQNWISNLPNATQALTPHPYISVPDNEIKTGSIHDFLGVPTSVASHTPIVRNIPVPVNAHGKFSKELTGFYDLSDLIVAVGSSSFPETSTSSIIGNNNVVLCTMDGSSTVDSGVVDVEYSKAIAIDKDLFTVDSKYLFNNLSSISKQIGTQKSGSTPYVYVISQDYTPDDPDEPSYWYITDRKLLAFRPLVGYQGGQEVENLFTEDDISNIHASSSGYIYIGIAYIMTSVYNSPEAVSLTDITTYHEQDNIPLLGFMDSLNDSVDYSELGIPLYSQKLRLNALPYRAYESIYNCYYRNTVINPLVVNGQVQYNKYITNDGDGADNTNYKLGQRNYELDFLTSALPSPQQGVAPVVGMTALGDITIEDENGITTAHAEIDNDGTVSKVVLTSPAASIEHARTAMNIAASGMSINDFRQTNALQRFLETNIRKGYRYMDFIAGHFGKEPNYNTLDLPEFIGGFSRDVNVSTVVSQADTLGDDSGKALGMYGGYASLVSGSNHNVRHYCDDYGFIIGIMSVVPTPCYSQLLPKHMIAPDNFLDYYFPEFSQSGMQPITYKEVAPIQSYLDSIVDPTKSLEDTFGYQRPNYDMVSAVDEVHGLFRLDFKNYVINRIFDTRPELGSDFIQIKPEEINDIFVGTNPDDDTIIGEIGFAVHAKRPVPRVVIPNLGK